MKIDNKYVLARAKKIVKELSTLSDGDRLWVLYTAINVISSNRIRSGRTETEEAQTVNINLIPRKRGCFSKIDKDVEVRNFIHQFPVFLSVEKLQQVLVDHFGRTRAPCVNTLSRYLKQMSQTTGQDTKGA